MYNEQQKLKFINMNIENQHTAATCRNMFEATANYEVKFGHDLCEMSTDEMSVVMSDIAGLRCRSALPRIHLMRRYVSWCSGLCEATNVPQTTCANNEKIRTMMIASPEHLQHSMDYLFDQESELTIDNTFRAYLWMAYGGLPEELLVQVTVKHVDLFHKVVNINGHIATLYPEAMQSILNCIALTSFVYKHPNYSHEIVRARMPGGVIVRGIKAAPSTKQIRSELSRRYMKRADKSEGVVALSYRRVWMSGLFYRKFIEEQAGVRPDFTDTALEFMSGKEYKLESGRNSVDAKCRQLARDYMKDYIRWKETFYEQL